MWGEGAPFGCGLNFVSCCRKCIPCCSHFSGLGDGGLQEAFLEGGGLVKAGAWHTSCKEQGYATSQPHHIPEALFWSSSWHIELLLESWPPQCLSKPIVQRGDTWACGSWAVRPFKLAAEAFRGQWLSFVNTFADRKQIWGGKRRSPRRSLELPHRKRRSPFPVSPTCSWCHAALHQQIPSNSN